MYEDLTIIWDWNGTLVDGVDISVSSMNAVLGKRNMPLLDRSGYRAAFSFPVKEFNRSIGFDFMKESFLDLAGDFISHFSKAGDKMDLFPEVVDYLNHFNRPSGS